MNEIIKINYDSEQQTVSARELHEKLNIGTPFTMWFQRMAEYGFSEGTDFFTKMLESTGGRPSTDFEISVDMAKQICMIQRTPEGKAVRQYLIDLEKAWNTPEQVFARALKMAEKTIESLKDKNITLNKENDLLAQKVLEWADRPLINALIRAYAHSIGNDHSTAWRDFKKELLYRHSINLNARITHYLNETGKKTKPKTLDMLDDSELQEALSTAVALCRENSVDISDIINKKAS